MGIGNSRQLCLIDGYRLPEGAVESRQQAERRFVSPKRKSLQEICLNFAKLFLACSILCLNCGQLSRAEIDPATQVTGLRAFHRNGQTFLLWNSLPAARPEPANGEAEYGVAQVAYKQMLAALEQQDRNGNKVRYRVYRSATAIKRPQDLHNARRIAEVAPLSIYYPAHFGLYWHAEKYQESVIPTLAVEAEQPLKPGQELYVHTVKESGVAYYAVVRTVNEVENQALAPANSLTLALQERVAEPEPVLQRRTRVEAGEHYGYHPGPATVYYYMRWVDEPYANQPRCFGWSVAVPDEYDGGQPAALQLALHSWGSTFDSGTYWYEISPASIRVATVNYPVQDWWYGYRKSFGLDDSNKSDVVFNYTERRLLSFVQWVKQNWRIDPNLVFIEGSSMGGTGAMQLGVKSGDLFCYSNSWVGIGSWRNSTYFRKGESKKWGAIDALRNHNGVKFDDWMDLAWWLRHNPQQETPFLSFANGKNDGAIGWEQAVLTVKALQETRRPFLFSWGMSGHGQRARFVLDPATMALNQSLPAFRNCTLDDEMGTARKLAAPAKFENNSGQLLDDWYDGDPEGQINGYLKWKEVEETELRYAMTVYLTDKTPEKACLVDVTPRRLQRFKAKPGATFMWANVNSMQHTVQSGEVTADAWGLLTVEKMMVTQGGNRLTIYQARPDVSAN